MAPSDILVMTDILHKRYHTIADRNWSRKNFIARPLSSKWTGKLQSVLAVNDSRLLVAAGNVIYSYTFEQRGGIRYEYSCVTSQKLQAERDMTSIATVPDGGLDRTIYIGYANGTLERVQLPEASDSDQRRKWASPEPAFREKCISHRTGLIESISATDRHLLYLSAQGTAVFLNHTLPSPSSSSHIIEIGKRGWSAYLSPRASTPYAAFGTSSLTPLTIHPILNTELSHAPSAILAASQSAESSHHSAVYGIAGAPPGSPWGASDQILVSGWYDGIVRVHDLRSSARSSAADTITTTNNNTNTNAPAPAPLLPVLSLCDPWSDEPIYAVSAGGGTSSHIAAGTARHSVVAFWDVRASHLGWSVHGPGNDSSPVYSVLLEGSRLFGATQSRPFVLDFGPPPPPPPESSGEDTYPALSDCNFAREGLKTRDGTGIGFYVTKYSHGRTGED